MIGQSFWSVFGWTIVWAVFATFLNYIFGILVALLSTEKVRNSRLSGDLYLYFQSQFHSLFHFLLSEACWHRMEL